MKFNKSDFIRDQEQLDSLYDFTKPIDELEASTYPPIIEKLVLKLGIELKYFQKHIIDCNKDTLISSPSGSGKTTAIIISALRQILKKKRVLIVANTKELLYNMNQLCIKLSQGQILTALLLGGAGSDKKDVAILEKNPKIIFATPGRLFDVLDKDGLVKRSRRYNKGKKNLLNLNTFSKIHIDEADALLTTSNMKTQCQLCDIIDNLDISTRGRAIRVFTSATYSDDAIRNAVKLCKNTDKKRLEVHLPKDISDTLPPTLQNFFVYLGNDDGKWEFESRLNLVFMMEKLFSGRQIIIYTHTRFLAEKICENLFRKNINFIGPNEDITPFQEERVNVLVAMDGLSRGIDFEAVSLVFNFTLPADRDTWVHRVGRSARRGLNGLSVTLFASKEVNKIESICKAYNISLEQQDMSYMEETQIDNCFLDIEDRTFNKMCNHMGVSSNAFFYDVNAEPCDNSTKEELISVEIEVEQPKIDDSDISPNKLLVGPSEGVAAEMRDFSSKEKELISPEEQLASLMEQVNKLKAVIAAGKVESS